jgi:peptide deformylase
VCFVDKVTDEDELKKQLNENNFNPNDVIKATT